MATTTNYGWTTPDNTDLVKDGASAIRTLGSSIDTTLKAQIDAQIPDTLLTTTGDVIYASAANTPSRLGIGSTGQVLTVASGVPSWAAASGVPNWSIINAGGTALTAAQTVTVSGITGANKLMVLIAGASSASASSRISVRVNTDTASNYFSYGGYVNPGSPLNATAFLGYASNDTSILVGQMASNAATTVSGSVLIDGSNSSGLKMYSVNGGAEAGAGLNQWGLVGLGGYWNGTATVSSVSVFSSTGNLDAGTVYVFKSA